MSERTPRWLDVARRHPSVELVRDAWVLIVKAVTIGCIDIEGLAGIALHLRAGGDVVLDGLEVWPSGSDVIVEVQGGSATVDREAFLDMLSAVTEGL